MFRFTVVIAAVLLGGCAANQSDGQRRGLGEMLVRGAVQSKAVDDHVEACLADRPGDLANCDRSVARTRYRVAQAKRDREIAAAKRAEAEAERERFADAVRSGEAAAPEPAAEAPSVVVNPTSTLEQRLSEELSRVLDDDQ